MKKWWQSKTVIFNIISGVVVVANELSGKLIPTEVATTVILVGNTILRLITNTSVSV
jgi:hypothetical protein